VSEFIDVREITSGEFELLWPTFHEVVTAGDTYSYAPDTSFEEARRLWTSAGTRCFVALINGTCMAGYMLRANQPGLGDHIANAGYMVSPRARGRGIAGMLCEHSMDEARRAGFTAMQFNYVVSTNDVAVRLWLKHGFAIVGRVPQAFRHAQLGPVDVLVMYRTL